MMVSLIDAHREEFGVEPICAQLPIAPSTYYNVKSARSRRDVAMIPLLVALWVANYRVYGAHKLGGRSGHRRVARLMRLAGIEGTHRRRRVRTTRPAEGAVRPADLVQRDFTASRPNRLWVSDLTYVATWAGVAYVCFIIDAFSRRIVGCAHAHRHGARRLGDGPSVPRRTPGRPGGAFGRLHVAALG